ncbi:hypothetical protein GCM10007301_35460 [Azorhizobium oxalatiphilum]|uniref:Hrp-dependent type III effector protein n=1 Tax=Azorhizobium oxalatiphilum TaxID=980631 RepID=A0A917FFC6_9HYPH|nr:four-carbon acid sugar kinase family protein [Azorhizobium oxalatiphilum]GGF72561.1 hypothetical protein GCM10007301_35460 [Azorhizobium oxalatiphilum]
MTAVRLIADDLTGALDAAISFVAPGQHIPVYWHRPPAGAAPASLALDSGTREADGASARRALTGLVRDLPRDRNALFYAKLDSLLRGQAAAEIAGWMEALAPTRCIIAPAFPHHGRITSGGIQHLCRDGARHPVGADLTAGLAAEGHAVRLCRPGDPVPDGISLWDAETDADLAAIAAAARTCPGTTLWCGSGGLAVALAGVSGRAEVAPAQLPRPLLGLFGTDHSVTRTQLSACGDAVLALTDGGPASARTLADHMTARGVVLATLSLPDGTPRETAAARIAEEFARVLEQMTPPATLVVSGGETLRGLCLALGAERLDLYGQIEAGVPCSILRGGRFDGVHVVSKSGAFGAPSLLRRLISTCEGEEA